MHPPSSHLFLLLQGGGIGYHPQCKYKYLIKAYTIYLIIMFIMNYYLLIITWIITDENDIDMKAEIVQYFLECLHVCAKLCYFIYRYKDLRELLKFVDEIRESSSSDPDNQSLIEKSEQTEKTIARCAVIGAESIVLIFFISTLMNYLITGKKKLPLIYWIPYDSQQYFWSAVIFQLLLFMTAVQVYMCSMGVNILLANVAISEMKILQRLLIIRDAKANTRLTAYKMHQNLNKLMFQMNDLLSGQFFFEISLSAIIISTRIFAFIRAVVAGKEGLFFTAVISCLSMTSPCAISWVGELIKSESEKIFEAAYDNAWYEEEEKTKKELILVLGASQRPHTLHYRHLVSFNFQQFGSLLQATYSYLTMLLKFGDL